MITMGYGLRTIITMGLGNGILRTNHVYEARPSISIIDRDVAKYRETSPVVTAGKVTSPKIEYNDNSPEVAVND